VLKGEGKEGKEGKEVKDGLRDHGRGRGSRVEVE
jgi:hypothetical protein